MNEFKRSEAFDPEALRKKISEIRTRAPDEKAGDEPSTELNQIGRAHV